jgi:hypothetical protein
MRDAAQNRSNREQSGALPAVVRIPDGTLEARSTVPTRKIDVA